MKPKTVITGLLLLFVVASVLALVVRETRPIPKEEIASSEETSVPAGSAPTPEAQEPAASQGPKTIAYYFHGNFRCSRCRAFEAYADEALKSGFPEDLASGRLEWRVVNVDQPENGHFVQDFSLTTRSLVLAESIDGKQVQWKNLERIWELVADKEAFVKYVQDETRAYLERN